MPNTFEQGLLRYLSSQQLSTIQKIRIGIGGAGGLGSNAAMILVRSGFKNFEILDHDIIDASNLNRQQYYLNEIGLDKIVVLKSRLLNINPDLNIIVHKTKWTPEAGASEQYFKNNDFIIEAFDKTESKHAFVDFYHDKVKYIVSGNGMAGLLEKEPLQVKRAGNIYFVGDGNTDAAAGHPPMAPRVTACAAMMAEIVLDLTLGLVR